MSQIAPKARGNLGRLVKRNFIRSLTRYGESLYNMTIICYVIDINKRKIVYIPCLVPKFSQNVRRSQKFLSLKNRKKKKRALEPGPPTQIFGQNFFFQKKHHLYHLFFIIIEL